MMSWVLLDTYRAADPVDARVGRGNPARALFVSPVVTVSYRKATG